MPKNENFPSDSFYYSINLIIFYYIIVNYILIEIIKKLIVISESIKLTLILIFIC